MYLMNKTVKLFLKEKEEGSILQGNPHIYDNEIAIVKEFLPKTLTYKTYPLKEKELKTNKDCKALATLSGSYAQVYSKSGMLLGGGILNFTSKIACRVFLDAKEADALYKKCNLFSKDFNSTEATIYLQTLIEKRIKTAIELRTLLYSKEQSCRLLFAEADYLPGFICDRYVDTSKKVHLVVEFLSLSAAIFREEVTKALVKFTFPYAIYERGDAAIRAKEGLPLTNRYLYYKESYIETPKEEVEDNSVIAEDKSIIIEENKIKLIVDYKTGQKTGHFLDQVQNRLLASSYCKGKIVLDAFCHIGGFGLAALKNDAKKVTFLDISSEAIEATRKNFTLNFQNLPPDTASFIVGDAFNELRKLEKDGVKFDVVMLDPPAFTKNAKNINKAFSGYKEVNMCGMRVLKEGGILVTSSCSYFFDAQTFYNMLVVAARDTKRRLQILSITGASFDHPIRAGYEKSYYLKCFICRVY